jgi:hypothetical protein
MEDDLKKMKWKMNQSTKINLIGCDTIVNSPSLYVLWVILNFAKCLAQPKPKPGSIAHWESFNILQITGARASRKFNLLYSF